MYGDKVLEHDRSAYVQFVKDGLSRGVLRLGARRREKVKVFFVVKKDGTLRLILDCRRSNVHFADPPRAALFSAASVGESEVPAGESVFYSQVDVENAFYQHALPRWLSEYFCLPGVSAGEFGIVVSSVGCVSMHHQEQLGKGREG